MALEILLTDSIAHAGAGIILSLLDFITYKAANPKTKRFQQKRACLESIEMLLNAEKSHPSENKTESDKSDADKPDEASCVKISVLSKDSTAYAEHVTTVREYMRTSGLVKLKLPVMEKLKDNLRNIIFHEKINTLSNMQKLWTAFGIEVLYDVFSDFRYHAVKGIAASLYQIPSFFAGLWIGNSIKNLIDILIMPADERKLDDTISRLLKETRIAEIVICYEPSENVQTDLAHQGLKLYASQLTRVGRNAFQHLRNIAETAKETAKDAAEAIINFPDIQEDTQTNADRKKRFDELTKDR